MEFVLDKNSSKYELMGGKGAALAKIGKVIAIIFAILIGIAVIFVMVVKDKEGSVSNSTNEQVDDKHG